MYTCTCTFHRNSTSIQHLIYMVMHMYVIHVLEQEQATCIHNVYTFLMQIESGHRTSSDLMEDFCDGRAFAEHPLFSLHSNGLQVFFYFDELEVCNPLGSKTKLHTWVCLVV